MLYIGDVPELQPHFNADGYDPVLRIKNTDDRGQTPHGIVSGQWLWTVTLAANYPEWMWPIAFAQMQRFGWTHCFQHVAALPVGGGYHGIFPVDDGLAAIYGTQQARFHAALLAHGIIPVCAGIAPDAPPAPGFDARRALVAMTDWDNSNLADSRLDALAAACPNALLFYERPGPDPRIEPQPDGHSTVIPTPDNGGAWIRSVQRRCPNFVGVVYEVNVWEGLDAAVAEITRCHPFYRDLIENRGETNTYALFWQGGEPGHYIRLDDELQRRCPWLHGYCSGGTPHPAPSSAPPGTGIIRPGDGFPFAAMVQHGGPAFTSWPATTTIHRLEIRAEGLSIIFDASDKWRDFIPPGWEGPIQYSIGLAMRIDGVWHGAAPIECWRGQAANGGPIYDRSVQPDNGIAGQIHAHWFPEARWGPLSRQPDPGELIGIFLVACDGRGTAIGVPERSNVVVIPMPSGPIVYQMERG